MGVVQGTSHPEHVVMDAESVSGHLLPSGSVYAFLAGHRRELFPDAMFADLFPSSLGRPSVPADVVAAVLVLQALEGRSDREATESLTFDALEGRVWAAGFRGWVPSDGADLLAAPAGGLWPSEPDLRRCASGGRLDRRADRENPASAGFHG